MTQDIQSKTLYIEALWKKIFFYSNYKNLSDDSKKLIDNIFADISENIMLDKSSIDKEKKKLNLLNEFNLETEIENLNCWLIDNKLGVIFSGLMGCHEFLRPPLTILHLFVQNKLSGTKIKFLSDKKNYNMVNEYRSELSDIFIAMLFGIYESGVDIDKKHLKGFVITSEDYPFQKFKQQSIKNKYEVRPISYSENDAMKDFNSLKFI